MNKERMRKALVLVLAVLLVFNTVWIYLLRREVTALKYQISGMESSLRANINSLYYELGNRYGDLETLIQKDQSMFSDSSVNYRLKNGGIRVELRAVPKALSGDEALFARVYAGNKMYEAPADGDGLAVVETEMAEYIRPMFVIKSADGVRQEALEEVYTGSLFEASVNTQWAGLPISSSTSHAAGPAVPESRWGLTLWIYGREEGLPFDPERVASAEFVVKNTGISESTGSYPDGQAAEAVAAEILGNDDSLFSADAGDRIPAKEIQGAEGTSVGYWADLSRYRDKNDGTRYEVYFCLTTADGIRFRTLWNPVASFSVDGERWTDMTTDHGTLAPVYQ